MLWRVEKECTKRILPWKVLTLHRRWGLEGMGGEVRYGVLEPAGQRRGLGGRQGAGQVGLSQGDSGKHLEKSYKNLIERYLA